MATSRSFLQLRRRLNFRGNEFEKNVNQKVRRAAIVADQFLVLGTPVDSGRAKSNWIVSLRNPVFEVLDAISPGEKGSTRAVNEQGALSQGQSIINQYTAVDGSIFITNSLPYIQALEEGSSQQAATGMVKQAIQAAQIEFSKGRVLKAR